MKKSFLLLSLAAFPLLGWASDDTPDNVNISVSASRLVYSLNVDVRIEDNYNENYSTSAGTYSLQDIQVDRKSAYLNLFGLSYLYEETTSTGNLSEDDGLGYVTVGEEAVSYEDMLHMIGIGTIHKTKSAFDGLEGSNHNKWSILYRGTSFKGTYQRGSEYENFEFDKTMYGLRYIRSSSPNFKGYMQYTYENATVPQVIHVNGTDFTEVDSEFNSQKHIGRLGFEWIGKTGIQNVLLDANIGLGYSVLKASNEMENKLDAAGIENPAISFGALDLATQIKVGYGVSGSVKDINFNAGVLLGWDFIWEHPFDEVTTSGTDSNGNETTTEHDTINYDRFENLTHYGFFVSITY